jgi:phage shock protein E
VISARDALAQLRNGALIIDVGSHGEFSTGHLPGAINLPLDEIETALPAKGKDKSRPLLLHCASGMRSGMAQRKLKGMGCANAFNPGACGRAGKIVESLK